ncbi:MerR family transcriptional regulator [Lactobacillus delbrueckii]|uniref:MerR family transcriptional regulator n=1 Tax=Lactobacillus delbrueckii TaxID=1584 RepID=UPI0037CC549F
MTDYYTSGEFAKRAHVSVRTIRYYDQQNLLKPSARSKGGARRYSDADFAKLQQILLLKYLGFSLGEIRGLTLGASDQRRLLDSLQIQRRLVEERIEEMTAVEAAIDSTTQTLEAGKPVDWSQMLELLHRSTMTQSLKTQYQNATNISARIRLHRDYSMNKEGWFPWLFRQLDLTPGLKILEIGCGNGELWATSHDRLPEDCQVILTDISEGMLADTKKKIGEDSRFSYDRCDAAHLPFADEEFDLVVANHMLFYCDDIPQVLNEVRRVLKKGGHFCASTYSKRHMHEITDLVQEFNSQIVLSSVNLYDRFGLDNGEEILAPFFAQVTCQRYEDAIELGEAEPVISYILSCHGNQNALLLDRYQEFKQFVEDEVAGGFHITKDAGTFICRK